MKKIFFVSDIHLPLIKTAEGEKRIAKFLRFLKKVEEEGSTLIIAGDLFDFWFEWNHVVPGMWLSVFSSIRQLKDKNIDIVFVCGNHDFYFSSYLEQEAGMSCFKHEYSFCNENRKFYVTHGDGLSKQDKGYRMLKRIIRSRPAIFCFKNFIHPDWGMKLAGWTSKTSREHLGKPVHRWAEDYFKYAKERFSEGYDFVIMGHLHSPEIREHNSSVYINCGDWLRHFSYAEFSHGTVSLKNFEEEEK